MISSSGSRNLRPVKIKSHGECQVVHVGKMEIWDGAEFALIRETLRRLVEDEACRSLAVDMRYVKYVPSGFFGALYDWYEKGVCVRVLAPLPHVQQMLWFTKFFHSVADEFHELGPCLEDYFLDPTSGSAIAQAPVIHDNVPLTTQDAGTSSSPVQANQNADHSESGPLLSNALKGYLSRK